MLILCGTPIGHLDDISYRAVKALESADVIYAEDTRRTLKLLNHLELKKPLRRYDEHNKAAAGEEILSRLAEGETVVLTTDAGMPGISDPGADLVRLCIAREIEFSVIDGPTAFVHAAIGSGFDIRRFAFEGFLPKKKSNAIERLQSLARDSRTHIFYEAPHDLLRTLEWIAGEWGDRRACTARELTKRYEEFRRGKLSELIAYYRANEPIGEFVLIVEGAEIEPEVCDEARVLRELRALAEQNYTKKEAVATLASKLPVKKSVIYRVAEDSRFF